MKNGKLVDAAIDRPGLDPDHKGHLGPKSGRGGGHIGWQTAGIGQRLQVSARDRAIDILDQKSASKGGTRVEPS